MNSHSCVKSLSILPTYPILCHISKHQFITVSTVLINTSPSSPTSRPTHQSILSHRPIHRSSLSHSTQPFLLDLPCTFYRSDLLFILSESPSPEQQRLYDNLSHNPACCRLLFLVIFGSILFNSCNRILHHSERINRVFLRIFR